MPDPDQPGQLPSSHWGSGNKSSIDKFLFGSDSDQSLLGQKRSFNVPVHARRSRSREPVVRRIFMFAIPSLPLALWQPQAKLSLERSQFIGSGLKDTLQRIQSVQIHSMIFKKLCGSWIIGRGDHRAALVGRLPLNKCHCVHVRRRKRYSSLAFGMKYRYWLMNNFVSLLI